MAGTVTTVNSDPSDAHGDVISKCVVTWLSDASGDATVTIDRINGVILRVVTNPGSTAPTDNWDIVINDGDGIDILAGQGVDRDTANSEHFCPGVALKDGTTVSVVPIAVYGPLSVVISNAGNAKNGTVTIYYR